MVKGISRQVIVVHSPEPKLFEQAIFILKEDAIEEGITDELLLKEAQKAIREGRKPQKQLWSLLWAGVGAGVVGVIWLLFCLL